MGVLAKSTLGRGMITTASCWVEESVRGVIIQVYMALCVCICVYVYMCVLILFRFRGVGCV